MTKQKHENHKYYKVTALQNVMSTKSYFNICWKIYSQINFELSRVKLQSKVPQGK